jgi:hypothetical protein
MGGYLGVDGHGDLRGRWLDPGQPRPSSHMAAPWALLLGALSKVAPAW